MFTSLLKRILFKLRIFPPSLIFEGTKYTNIKDSNLLIEIFISNSYEEEMLIFFDFFRYDHFFDIGANIGLFSFYATKIKGWPTTAYEAYPRNIEYIKKIMKLNNIFFEISETAISNKFGKSKFHVPIAKNSSKLASSSTLDIEEMKRIYEKIKYETIEVSTIPFSSVLKDINPKKNYLIKIDVEGWEYKIISSTKILETLRNVDLIIEFNINNPFNNKLFNLLINFGYDSYLMTNKGLIREFKPLTIPKPKIKSSRTIWRNHFFTKKPEHLINKINKEKIGYVI